MGMGIGRLLPPSGPLYPFVEATFTPGGQVGPLGPSLSQARSGLSGTGTDDWKNNTEFFNTSNGIQKWVVPTDGTYRIEVAGSHSSPRRTSGRGAIIRADYNLTQGQILNLVVGQPEFYNATKGGTPTGGGGGTYVAKSITPLSNTTMFDFYAVAGGGGGVHNTTTGYDQNTADANFSSSGNPGTPGGSPGGTAGDGGGYTSGGGSAGAGAIGDGNGRTSFVSLDGELPKSYLNGSVGGGLNGSSSNQGGFGGGGFTWYTTGWGGGGGGWSGGGHGSNSNFNGNAGGGGSANGGIGGTNEVNVGHNSGPGYVTITLL